MSNSEQKYFEEQWRKVFEDASMKPPAHLWDGIEAELDKDRFRRDDFFETMSSEQHNFEEQWQNIFADASMKPSPQLWDNIEAELDKDRRRRPVFFLLRPSYLVGGIAALLLMIWGGIVLISKPPDSQRGGSAVAEKNSKKSSSENADLGNSKKSAILNPKSEDSKELIVKNSEEVGSINSGTKKLNGDVIATLSVQSEREVRKVSFEGQNLKDGSTMSNNQVDKSLTPTNSNTTQVIDNQSRVAQNIENKHNQLDANQLNSKGFEPYKNRFQPRKYLLFDTPEIETESIAKNESKFWVGLQSGVSPFNPNLNLGNIQTSASAQAAEFAKSSNQNTAASSPSTPNTATDNNFITVGVPKNQVRSGIATNFGFATGYQLNKKWSIESGLRYFSGNSNLLSNTYSINEITGQVNAFFADYVANKQSANTIVADAESYNNRYQYLMIPVQAGYQIPVRKNLNMSLLAGFSTDVFLQNAISSAGNFVSESRVNQGVYRKLNLSGLGGVRANYFLNRHWQANMGVNYQQAIFSGFKADNLNMQYRLFGLQYGLSYRF
jgi:hypothetical protein